jgi:hypothetical protein
LTRIWAEKLVSLLLTLWLVAANDWPAVVLIYIVLGQGHFLTAYFYQWKAGKMTRGYLLRYLLAAAAIVGCYTAWPDYRRLVAFTTIYFLLHMLWDEQYLLRLPMDLRQSPMHLGRTLEMAPIVLLFSARVVDDMFAWDAWRTTPFVEIAQPSCWGILAVYLLCALGGLIKTDYKSAYLLGWGIALLGASYTTWYYRIPTGKVTGFIIIYHYLNWYLHYYLSLPAGRHREVYARRVFFLNALVVGAYFTWGSSGPGRWFFQNDWFYVWTLLHLITSTRIGDLRNLIRLPQADQRA